MAYRMFFGEIEMPQAPSKITTKISGNNKTLFLIDGSQINILKDPKLTDISFDLVIPQASYPWVSELQTADYYLSMFETLITSKEAFQWILNRTKPDGTSLFNSSMTVSLEDYSIVDDATEGFDVTVKVELKQWRDYGTRTLTVSDGTATIEEAERDTSSSPASSEQSSYTVVSGDCLWNIAKKYLGDGSRYTEIVALNSDLIDDPDLIYPGQVLTLPAS